MARIERKAFKNYIYSEVVASQNSFGVVWLEQVDAGKSEADKVLVVRATLLAICRHLGVTAKELEGTE